MAVDLSIYRTRKKPGRPVSYLGPVDWQKEVNDLYAIYAENDLTDAKIPWWAVSLLPLKPGSEEYHCRRAHQLGRTTPTVRNAGRTRAKNWGEGEDFVHLWKEIVGLARSEWEGATPRDAIREDRKACQRAALSDPRAFTQFTGLLDDDLQPWILKGFHVKAVIAMRCKALACILLPFAHGKSALSSIVVPLMDWADNPESTQIRIYHSGNFTKIWTRKLMDIVENNEQLHSIFPWIRKPERGDPCSDIWSTDGFSIGGKRVVDPSFRPLTAGSSIVGVRADRVGADDWVNEFNSTSQVTQEKFYNYLKTGVLTMRRHREHWNSPWMVKWGTVFIIGTVFDRRDVNYRIWKEWNDLNLKGKKQYYTMKFGVYPYQNSREKGEVIWPEYRPIEYIRELEISLGRRAFRMRCENKPVDTDETVFTEKMLDEANRSDLVYGELPQRAPGDQPLRYLIAYDPATGTKRNRNQAYPAAVLMGQSPTTEELHFIRYERWAIPQPRQVDRLIDWARRYSCSVCVESNNIQASYRDWISERAPDVRVTTHYTSDIKHDPGAGVESLLPLFENGKVRIHTGGVDPVILREFREEFLEWPQGRYSDMLMAAWIGRYQLRLILRNSYHNITNVVPEFVTQRGNRRFVDLSKYR
jgi:hypothetical protein